MPRLTPYWYRFLLLAARSISLELWYCWVKMVPRLSTSHPNVRLGPEPTGIVEARGPHSKIFDRGRARRKQWRTAGRAKRTLRGVAALGQFLEMCGLPLRYRDCAACHDQSWRKGAPARNLAVATMAIEHSKRQCPAFVADGATRAAAGEWDFHGARHSDALTLR